MLTFILGITLGLAATLLFLSKKERRVKLLEQEKELLQQEKQIVVEFMHNVVEAVGDGSERETMLQRIIHAAVVSTGALSACIYLKQADQSLNRVAVEGLFPPQRSLARTKASGQQARAQLLKTVLEPERFHIGEGLIGQVAKAKRAELIKHAERDPRIVQHEDPSLKTRSLVVAPVLFKDELLAVLAVANPSDGLSFTETDFSLVESLAEQVGLALHNSDALQLQIEKKQIDLDIELAAKVQGLLLPKHYPPSDKIAFASHYTAARKIGGDLYDVFSLDAETTAFAIADVSGKGVSASILMAICQTHLRHYSRIHRSPAKVLSAINAAMSQTMQRDMFITMIYAVLDLKTEALTLARAGHELPFFYDSHDDGSLDVGPIRSPGMAIGMVGAEIFDTVIGEAEIHFGENDALLLYTDGVTECTNAKGEEFSSERLLAILKDHGDHDANTILDRVLNQLDAYASEGGYQDDLTMIAVKHA